MTTATNAYLPASSATPAVSTKFNTYRWLALGAVAGPLLFASAWLVLGFLSPGYSLFGALIAPYSPVSQPVSGLGLGSTATFMNATFVLSGILLLGGVIGVFGTIRMNGRPTARWASAALLALSPLGLVADGVFTLESILPHLIGFLLGVATPVLSFLVAGLVFRAIPRWRRFGTWLLLGSPLTLLLVVLFFATFDPVAAGAGFGVAGLTQRILVLEVHAWFAVMGWLAFRRA